MFLAAASLCNAAQQNMSQYQCQNNPVSFMGLRDELLKKKTANLKTLSKERARKILNGKSKNPRLHGNILILY